MLRRRRGATVVILAFALLAPASGCGRDGGEKDPGTHRAGQREPETVAPAHCPPEVLDCRTAQGRIAYVERVDPDGDGDAHFVIVDPQGITVPGLTVIDVHRGLRPDPLPGQGDLISAAGPVQEGSYGQSQIHALELHVARAGAD
jgi:hypothetical protein